MVNKESHEQEECRKEMCFKVLTTGASSLSRRTKLDLSSRNIYHENSLKLYTSVLCEDI